MAGGEQLRSLYIDIEANSDDAISDIEATSQVADSAAESFEDLASASTVAGSVLDFVEEQSEALGDTLSETTGKALALNSALRTLPEQHFGNLGEYDIDSVDVPTPDIDTSDIAKTEIIEEKIDDVKTSAIETAVSLKSYASQADEAGDESLTASAKVQSLDTALTGLGGSSNLNSTSAGMSAIFLAATALLPVILSLGAAFGGLAVAGLGLAGVLGGSLAGGFLGLSERVGGAEALLVDFKDALKRATEPLQGPLFQEFTLDVLRGAVKWLHMASEAAAETFKNIQPVIDTVSAAFWDNTPEFFSALQYSVEELAPILADLMVWLANSVPDAIVYLTDTAKELAPTLADLGDSLIPFLVQLTELGVVIVKTLGPALALLLDGLTLVLKAFNALPDWVQSLFIGTAAAVLSLAAGISILGGAIMGVIGLFSKLLLVARVGSMIYGLVGGVGLLSTVLGGLSSALTIAAGAVSTFFASLGPVGWAILAIGAAITAYTTNFLGFKDAVDAVVGSVVKFGGAIIGAILNPLETLQGVVDAVLSPLETLGGVFEWISNLSLADLGGLSLLAPAIAPFVAGAKAAQALLEKLGLMDEVMGGLRGTINALLNPVQALEDGLQYLANLDVIDVVVNLIKQGAEDLWNWLTPDIGGLQKKLGKKLDGLQQKAQKKLKNLTPEEQQQVEALLEFRQKFQNFNLDGILPDIPSLEIPEVSIPDINLPNITLPEIDFSGLIPDVDELLGIDDWGEKGKDASDTLIDGLTSIDVGKRVGEWLKGLVPFMPGSDAQTGPLSNLTSWGESFGETIVSGLKSIDIGKQVGNWLQSTAQGIKQWGEGIYNSIKSQIPSLEDIQSALPDMPSISMPEMPDIPSLDDLTSSIDLPSGSDVQSALPDIPSLGDIAPNLSMPDMPDVDLPDVGDLSAGIDIPSMGDMKGAMPSLGNIGSSIEDTLGVSLPDTGPLFSAGSHLRNQLASGGQDIASAVGNANLGSVDIPTIDQALSLLVKTFSGE